MALCRPVWHASVGSNFETAQQKPLPFLASLLECVHASGLLFGARIFRSLIEHQKVEVRSEMVGSNFKGVGQVTFGEREFFAANLDQGKLGVWFGGGRIGLDGLAQAIGGLRQVVLANSQPSQVQVCACPRLWPCRY